MSQAQTTIPNANVGVRQWLRKCSLIAGDAKEGTELSALRVTFEIQSMTTSTPSTLAARIYNLSKSTYQKLHSLKNVPTGEVATPTPRADSGIVTLRAGYEGNYGIIFKGELIQVRSGRDSYADKWTELFAGDGDWWHVWGMINVALSAGWQPKDVNDKIKSNLKAYGLNVGDLPDTVPQAAAPRGKVCFGMTRDCISTLQKTHQTDAFVRQGNLEWLPVSAYRPGDVVVINATSGMVGLPQQTNFGITVRILLNPSVSPGTLIHVNNKDIQRAQYVAAVGETHANLFLEGNLSAEWDGTYKVIAVNHLGDTRGVDWYTDITAMAVAPVGPVTPEAVEPIQFKGFNNAGVPIY